MLDGMVPPRELEPRCRYVSPNTLPIQVGIVPTSMLLLSDKSFIYEDGVVPERTQIEDGIDPVRLLNPKFRFKMFGSVIAGVTGPVKKLLSRCMVFRAVRRIKLSGMGPVNLLYLRRRLVSAVRPPMLAGIDPSISGFPLNSSVWRDDRPLRLDGMVPLK